MNYLNAPKVWLHQARGTMLENSKYFELFRQINIYPTETF